jgi:hypothetical protein
LRRVTTLSSQAKPKPETVETRNHTSQAKPKPNPLRLPAPALQRGLRIQRQTQFREFKGMNLGTEEGMG